MANEEKVESAAGGKNADGPVKDVEEERIESETKRQKKDGGRMAGCEAGKKPSGRKTDCRRFSKDGAMEAKTETSLTGSRLPTQESTWPRGRGNSLSLGYLSTCLPLPPIRLFLLLRARSSSSIHSSSSFHILLLFIVVFFSIPLSPSSPSSSLGSPALFLHTRLSSRVQGGPLLPPLSLVRSTPIRGVVSRKFIGNAFVERGPELVPPLKP